MPKILVTITGTYHPDHSNNWIECISTWVPKLKEKGFDFLCLMSNPYLEKEYERIGDFFFSKCGDSMDWMYLKNHYYVSKYFLNETDYEYRFHTDMDTFVHPERFIGFIQEYTEINPKDYVGCVIPYNNLNPHTLRKLEIKEPNYYASGGSGFLLSRKSHEYMVKDFQIEEYETLYCCDKITGSILNKNGIKLWHDSRLLFESPYKRMIYDPHGIGTPFIGEKESFLVAQHYCHTHMKEIMNKLEL